MKTLKDIQVILHPDDCPKSERFSGLLTHPDQEALRTGYCCGHTDGLVQLRQEAVKWIKELQKLTDNGKWAKGLRNDLGDFGSYNDFDDYTDFEGLINWIKHFFGINEEDLK